MIEFNRWPVDLAERYRQKGYWIDQPLSEILDIHHENNAIALICGEQVWRYRELNDAVNRLAAALLRRGARRGQTALVQLGNEAEFYIVFFALLRVGVAPVNALFSHQRSELTAYAQQIQPDILIADREHRQFHDDVLINQLKSDHQNLNIVVLHHTDSSLAQSQSLAQLMSEDMGDFVPTPTPADEVAFFQLSGGSTGTPKLIPRTHNDYYYSIRASNPICGVNSYTRYLCALPAGHNYPLSSPGALGVFYAGGQVILTPNPSPESCFPAIYQHHVNMTALVPPAVSIWLECINLRGSADELASLKVLLVGGAPFGETLARRIQNALGCQLQQVFGMAEGLVNYTRHGDDDIHTFTMQGRPISEDDEVWIANSQGQPVPYGEPGLLMTRGPYTFRGYYRSPEYNQRVFDANGFYCSGDVVTQYPDGYLKVIGREKDQINRGGEKIAAEEIEHLLLRHPAVTYAALVAIPDRLMGEKTCAYVVTRETIKPAVLRRWLREQGIADYKLPDRVETLPELPLTPVGKINKQALRALAAANLEHQGDAL